MDAFLFIAILCAALACGLVAGIFFAFSNFVMRGLARIEPVQGIAAMQSINVTVINPLFALLLFGLVPLCLYLAIIVMLDGNMPGARYILAGSALYLFGAFLVTFAFNIPLNDALEAVEADSPEAAALWPRYVSKWTAWNHVRTVGALLASAAFTLALCL